MKVLRIAVCAAAALVFLLSADAPAAPGADVLARTRSLPSLCPDDHADARQALEAILREPVLME